MGSVHSLSEKMPTAYTTGAAIVTDVALMLPLLAVVPTTVNEAPFCMSDVDPLSVVSITVFEPISTVT
jgi:hypothetical protein